MPQDKMHLAPLRLSRQEIDTYIVQARERSYEMMVRFGKRGLNLAATAAVQAATKVPGMGMGCWVSPRMLRPRGSGKKFPPQCGCSWWCHSPAWCDGITLGVPSALLFALRGAHFHPLHPLPEPRRTRWAAPQLQHAGPALHSR